MNILHCQSTKLSSQVRIILSVVTAILFIHSAAADELITLKTRPDVTQSVLLWEPHDITPDTIILLFAGGTGNVRLGMKDGRADAAGAYLFSRHREIFLQPQFAVAIVDAPSDYKDMDEEFRMSARHSTDIEAVAREFRNRFPKARLVLMGHSRGTVSAGYVARALGDQVSAVVLLSGRYQPARRALWAPPGGTGGAGLSQLDLASLKSPVLVVHHARDGCSSNLLASTTQLSAHLPKIIVDGNNDASTSPGLACSSGTNHWFAGIEKATGDEVIKWLSGKTWARTVP